MKNLKYIIIALLFISACSSKEEQKLNEFLSNFEDLKLPYSVEGIIDNNSGLKRVDIQFVDILADTTGKIIEYEGEKHFSTDYFYLGKLFGNENFDIIILSEYACPPSVAPILYKLYTISKTGKIISSIPFAESFIMPGEESFLSGNIDKNLKIETIYHTKSWDIATEEKPYDFKEKTFFIYTIKDDGKIKFLEEIESETKNTILPDEKINKEITEDTETKIKKYFTQEQITFLSDVKNKFENIKSSKDVADIYKIRYKIGRTIDEMLYKQNVDERENTKNWAFLNDYLPGMSVVMGAEGSGNGGEYSLMPLYKKAIQTPETDDELFFEAYSNGRDKWIDENEFEHLSKFQLYECLDMENCFTLLGGGKVLKIIQRIKKAEIPKSNFTEELKDFKYSVISELETSLYGYTKEQTLYKLNKIAEELSSDNELLIKIEKIKEHINGLSDDNFNYIK